MLEYALSKQKKGYLTGADEKQNRLLVVSSLSLLLYLLVKSMNFKFIVLVCLIFSFVGASSFIPLPPFTKNQYDVKRELSLYFSPVAVAAIMGNIAVQAPKFDYRSKQVGGNGYGLFQFDFLKTYYIKYLIREKRSDSAKSQIAFMVSTLVGKDVHLIGTGIAAKVLQGLKAEDLNTATTTFMKEWERPEFPLLERRLAKAQHYYQIFYGKK